MPRPLLDEVKKLASDRVGVPADHILISATHSHSAPSSLACLGTDADPNYVPFLRAKLVEAIAGAFANLEPARVGWGSIDAAEFTALRRWIRRPDRIVDDPFGNPTVRANMHAGRNWDDVVGESGPEDPRLSLVALQSTSGRPIAVLANFSMHYFSDTALSADYFGLFSEGLRQRIAPEVTEGAAPFVGMLSHGCSGDIWRRDYMEPEPRASDTLTIAAYTDGLLDLALTAYGDIEYTADADLEMAEARLPMKYRVPDKQRLEWAQRVVDAMGDRLPATQEEVYAREQLILHERQTTEVVVQALRIGDIGIATTPTETYALTGLKIKALSPLAQTMVFDLANGGDGYIPPIEQHRLGGYNTWPARSAGLEVTAEARIAEAAVQLLEQVADQPRRDPELPQGAATAALLAADPSAYWRLNEFAGPWAVDASRHGRDALYEDGVVYYLPGLSSARFSEWKVNRAPQFVGGRLHARLPELGDQYSVAMWIWDGLPAVARPVNGWILSRGHNHALGAGSEHVGIGGTAGNTGALIYQRGAGEAVAGTSQIERWMWHHVALVRNGKQVQVFLDGDLEIDTTSDAPSSTITDLFIGGRCDNDSGFEGRIDEVGVFDRALTSQEVKHLAAVLSIW